MVIVLRPWRCSIYSTATLPSEGVCGWYGSRLMHRLDIFLSYPARVVGVGDVEVLVLDNYFITQKS